MPLYQLTPLPASTLLGLWRVEETVEGLQRQLHTLLPHHPIPAFKAESRTREWLAARVLAYTLLQKLEAPPLLLETQENGGPVCSNPVWQVSLTHSGPWVGAVVSSTQQVGIDIEMIQEKIRRLAPRFLNEEELKAAADDLEKVHIYWSAKETLYKVYRQRELFFREQLLLQDFDRQPAGFFEGRVATPHFDQTYQVQYEVHSEFVLTYVLAPLQPPLN